MSDRRVAPMAILPGAVTVPLEGATEMSTLR